MNNFIVKSTNFMLIFILLLNCIFIPLNVYGATNDNLTEKQQAIVNIANAYYSQGVGIQYDQNRRFLNVKPEEAKDRWPIYLDCSSFVYNVYLQAFNIKLQKLDNSTTYLNTTKKLVQEAFDERSNTSYIPYYLSNPKSNITKNNLLNKLNNLLQVGDLLVYRKKNNGEENSGHVLLYLGNGELIHCTGKKFDFEELEDYREETSIKKTTLKKYIANFFNTNVSRLAVIRPLNSSYLKNASLTDYAKIKNELPELDVVTTSSPWNLKTVNPGSSITYSIYLKNKSNQTMKNLIINEEISKFLTVNPDSIVTKLIKTVRGKEQETIIANIVTINNNTLSGTINSIEPNTKIKITYKAKVSTNESYLGKIIKTQVQIGKMIDGQEYFEATNTIKLTIGKTLNSSKQNAIIQTAREYVNKSYNGKARNLVDEIYYKALGIDTQLEETTIKNMLSKIITTDKNGKTIFNTDQNVINTKTRKTLVNGFYGYRYAATIGTRYLTIDNLISGDIIIYSNNDKYYMYLYLSENELMTINNGKVIIRNNVQERLDKIVGSDKFAVLRPSLDM